MESTASPPRELPQSICAAVRTILTSSALFPVRPRKTVPSDQDHARAVLVRESDGHGCIVGRRRGTGWGRGYRLVVGKSEPREWRRAGAGTAKEMNHRTKLKEIL
eukprot:767501-Hanusia_phi.AAC.3